MAGVWVRLVSLFFAGCCVYCLKADTTVRVYVKFSEEGCALPRLARVVYSAGRWAVVEVSLTRLAELKASGCVEWIDAVELRGRYQRLRVLDEEVRGQTRAVFLHEPLPPLVRKFTGRGVLVGVADAGIDPLHPDFLDSAGNSRFLYLWDQTDTLCPAGVSAPQPYGYGCEYRPGDISNGVVSVQLRYLSHGTGVASLAAGNSATYKGMAPEAALIGVELDFSKPTAISDAVHYIFSKADTLGLPVVVNLSVGSYWGSHDGKDPQAELIASMIREKRGRVVVAAAGNGGSPSMVWHAGDTLVNDTLHLFFRWDNGELWYRPDTAMVFHIFTDTNSFQGLTIQLSADSVDLNTSPSRWYRTLSATRWWSLSALVNDTIYDTLYLPWGDTLAYVRLEGLYWNDTTSMLFEVYWDIRLTAGDTAADGTPHFNRLVWRLSVAGTGWFDIWSHVATTGTSVMHNQKIGGFPDSLRVLLPDNRKTLASSFQCRDEVITVANYAVRSGRFVTLSPSNPTYLYRYVCQRGALYYGSSRGPTRDGRQKPDISAGGECSLCAVARGLVPILLEQNALYLDGLHRTMGGTSSAAPIVAGAVALYQEARPDAWWWEVKQALLDNATVDEHTGTAPNYGWGWGKVNILSALMPRLRGGCTDSSALNFVAWADYDDGSCEYGVVTGVPAQGGQAGCFYVAMSPDARVIILHSCGEGQAVVYDIVGRELQRIRFIQGRNIITLPASGIYWLEVEGKKYLIGMH